MSLTKGELDQHCEKLGSLTIDFAKIYADLQAVGCEDLVLQMFDSQFHVLVSRFSGEERLFASLRVLLDTMSTCYNGVIERASGGCYSRRSLPRQVDPLRKVGDEDSVFRRSLDE